MSMAKVRLLQGVNRQHRTRCFKFTPTLDVAALIMNHIINSSRFDCLKAFVQTTTERLYLTQTPPWFFVLLVVRTCGILNSANLSNVI